MSRRFNSVHSQLIRSIGGLFDRNFSLHCDLGVPRQVKGLTPSSVKGAVAARAKYPLARARYDADMQRWIAGKYVESLIKRLMHFRRERIHLIQTVYSDPEYAARSMFLF